MPNEAIPAAGRRARFYSGYVPCGYFQLWNPFVSRVDDYPIDDRGTAEGSDMLHALR